MLKYSLNYAEALDLILGNGIKHIDRLKNFGIVDETTVVEPGTNGKMNELQSAYGLLHLKYIDGEIEKRLEVAERYRKWLAVVRGIRCLDVPENVKPNGASRYLSMKRNSVWVVMSCIIGFVRRG